MKAKDLMYMLHRSSISLALQDIQLIDEHPEEIDPTSPPEELVQESIERYIKGSSIHAERNRVPIVKGNQLKQITANQLEAEVNEGAWGYISSPGCDLYLWFKSIEDAEEFIQQQIKGVINQVGIIDTNTDTVKQSRLQKPFIDEQEA